MRKRFSQKLLSKVRDTTNHAFESSVMEVLGLPPDITDIELAEHIHNLRYGKYLTGYTKAEVDNLVAAKEKIDELYLVKLCALPSDMLENIIFIHKRGDIKRATRTIDTILSELTRRFILSDSFESDLIKQNGEMDEIKTADNTKRTKAKRSRTSKSR